ncbi:unnamed protein product, partial [Allacma fusca]
PVALPEITTPTPEPPSQVVTYAPVVSNVGNTQNSSILNVPSSPPKNTPFDIWNSPPVVPLMSIVFDRLPTPPRRNSPISLIPQFGPRSSKYPPTVISPRPCPILSSISPL